MPIEQGMWVHLKFILRLAQQKQYTQNKGYFNVLWLVDLN